jgi:hypothetical protein
MKLEKIKRPGGSFYFSVEPLVEDEFGTWLHAPAADTWEAPHGVGTLPMDVLILLSADRHWAVWWVDDPTDRRIEIDICLPPERVRDGWRYIDLELDPVRHADGTVEIQDHDEFEAACRNGWITAADAEIALGAAPAMEAALRRREEPLGEEGWRRLDIVRRERIGFRFPCRRGLLRN